MPAWRDIDPAAIKEHLPLVWSWRWEPALATFVGRLAGEEIIAYFGLNPRGKRVEDCFPQGARELVIERYKRVVGEPALMHSRGKVYLLAGGDGWGERIAMPLAADGLNGDGIFGATVYRLSVRPLAGNKVSVDHVNQVIEFFALSGP
jgi:hypothetical protein